MLERVRGFNFSYFMGQYSEELTRSMSFLAADKRTLFLGQAVSVPGTAMYGTLEGVDIKKRIEFPVAEEFQMGVSTGLALTGLVPISIFPRWNFLLMGVDQVVNHLDKFIEMSNGKLDPKVIIRVAVGSERPVDPQCQHKGNFSESFRLMTRNTEVIELFEPEDIVPAYEKALNRTDGINTILVEFGDFSKEK